MKPEYVVSIVQMTKSSKETLLYNTKRDDFNGSSFLSKLNGKTITETIIQTNEDYVFTVITVNQLIAKH